MNYQRTCARPYAKAIFELACEEKTLDFWSHALRYLACIAEDAFLQAVYQDARYTAADLSQIFISVLKKLHLDHPFLENLVFLLSHYKRLPLLAIIAMLYEEYKSGLEKTVQISITSAFPLSDAVTMRLKKSLENRLQRGVEMNYKTDKTLIGGAVIRTGDLVIDGSVKNKLEKLKRALILD